MVSTRFLFLFQSSKPFINPLVTVPSASIIIGITVTFLFHSFPVLNLGTGTTYLSFHFFSIILWSAGTAKAAI